MIESLYARRYRALRRWASSRTGLVTISDTFDEKAQQIAFCDTELDVIADALAFKLVSHFDV